MVQYETSTNDVHREAAGRQRLRRKSAKWYGVFVDFNGILRRLPLDTDRRACESLARTVDRLNSVRGGNDSVLPPDLARDVETMPADIRDRLAKWDIILPERHASTKPLLAHAEDWRAAILAKGGTEHHAGVSASRVKRVITGCGFATVGDVSASKVQRFISDLRQDRTDDKGNVHRGISAASFNYYLRDARSFFRWMVRDGRALASPLEHLQGMNAKTDRRHERRALSVDELRWLLDVTERGFVGVGPDGMAAQLAESVTRFNMTPSDRAMLYLLAVETGLRSSELRSLTRGSFNLEGDEPSVTIDAAYAKNRRQDTLPLKLETAATVARFLSGKMPTAPAFVMPKSDRIVEMIQADLAAARKAWLGTHRKNAERFEAERSSFLAYRDEAGRCADFHALRHTFISNLAAGGIHPKTAQRLARHSTITLTMDRYTHLRREDLAGALDALPDLSSARQAAMRTGTDGENISLSPSLPPNREFQRTTANTGGVKSDRVASRESLGNTVQNTGFSESNSTNGLLAELADALDSKSNARKGVSVRLR